ncbi:hypothetical protein MPLDJ20_20077 [Mesorhizobium plurifarium]|uniref:Uncharacterized protein n=1 Tax=Mesorhizobium plurifarium TaxID=69974 RepID=A0A090GKB6_MESPL|nr:hypothetical protein MPLDJ20_20077 [Mesorhizobium plurifarium]CDX38555.1 hypothetical protein MPLSOD_330069 [Mesorhizobium sp. SOD10]
MLDQSEISGNSSRPSDLTWELLDGFATPISEPKGIRLAFKTATQQSLLPIALCDYKDGYDRLRARGLLRVTA